MSNAISCAICGDTGWAHIHDGNLSRVTRCACWVAKRKTFADGVPLEFQAAILENYRELKGNSTALKAAKAFASSTQDLYLCGGVGAGKTRLACTLLNEAYAKGQPGWFVRIPMLLFKLQPARTDEAGVEAERLLHRLSSEPLVVLDDIGAERDTASDFTRRTLLTIYEERGDKGLRTIWTSNLRLEADLRQSQNPHRAKTLGEFMSDDRLASRIAGRSEVIWLGAGDQRLAPKADSRKAAAGEREP